jgi:hypothetical protein
MQRYLSSPNTPRESREVGDFMAHGENFGAGEKPFKSLDGVVLSILAMSMFDDVFEVAANRWIKGNP